jgi:hypothetical protein
MTLIIFGIFLLAAFWSGFYVGYLKREDKKPDSPQIDRIIKKYFRPKGKPEKTKGFYD